MKLKFEYNTEKDYVYINMHNDDLHIGEFYKCKYKSFFNKYYKNHMLDINMLEDDLVDTLMNVMAIPCTKDEIKENLHVTIYSDIIKIIAHKNVSKKTRLDIPSNNSVL